MFRYAPGGRTIELFFLLPLFLLQCLREHHGHRCEQQTTENRTGEQEPNNEN